jgi:hypothetical protein
MKEALPVMFLFLTLPIPICWRKSQPGDKFPTQPEPQEKVRDEEKTEATQKLKKAAIKKFSRVISAFIKGVMTWSVSIILVPLQVLPICYSLCLVYRV